ncbi:hypothetical protein SALBM217S_05211 [Streptomyces griseoloalbus]
MLDFPDPKVTRPVVDYVRSLSREDSRDMIGIYIPEYVVGRWWENLLHNQSDSGSRHACASPPASW